MTPKMLTMPNTAYGLVNGHGDWRFFLPLAFNRTTAEPPGFQYNEIAKMNIFGAGQCCPVGEYPHGASLLVDRT